ncbi:MAG: MarC family protein [Archangium sp.]|nr:MarC family protein [Archangium sp.]
MIPFSAAAFTALFVVVEPIGVVPMFAALTRDRPRDEVRRIAFRASVVGGLVLTLFALGGRFFLDALGVRIDAFRMAGGLLLLLTALDMLRAKQSACRCSAREVEEAQSREDLAIVPVAIPLLAGPGAMATVMMLMSRATSPGMIGGVFVAIALTFLASYLVLRSAEPIARWMGPSVTAVVQRVLGLVLAAMSLQFIVEGGLNLLNRG